MLQSKGSKRVDMTEQLNKQTGSQFSFIRDYRASSLYIDITGPPKKSEQVLMFRPMMSHHLFTITLGT